jgi:hypothetical protein
LLENPASIISLLVTVDVHFAWFVWYAGEFQTVAAVSGSYNACMSCPRYLSISSLYAENLLRGLICQVIRPMTLLMN